MGSDCISSWSLLIFLPNTCDRQFIERKQCYNVTVPVTIFKHLPLNTGKTIYLDRLCLESSPKDSRANFGRLFGCWL